ncbi:MAG: arginine--tRNA ligase [Candidatus Infernicultor aquiphilus]|uniref:Arginine--tRNA ligase n=1 Tax=Candidatus Infernicultor aquiphilus TaxID=1805029 RepID=A0A1J5GK15_9BACT|nr:arginine--tRNA ligase [bacterium]OIP69930.1 MAG: arginine--tRNA ligase [Candidatus Atribacteria bacterium CG2_30_33_13]PIU25512.1 MAG: arginine--tRNA ligase [Candidatus Atribacteria bacterium CG08_land_8_20_14_0_20_33_29]PIX35173.1 MAG: arginine--tRNA ligase [Candidatus Atribacteria bacterium CG_4_8_14_3_um_filter_34_18]PIY31355.1 MAG: arginine--tRNA ligase [Candidatus Atribacteria bacterium CG_4_10_14_3_um_filter_34_13]PJB56949.1 MAG: arginine--tRNA ligase [Candidatus Atribacteria bacteriu
MKTDVIAQVKKTILDSIEKNIKQSNFQIKIIPEIILLTPKNKSHGDLSTNIAMQLSRELKLKPLDIAHFIVDNLNIKDSIIGEVEMVRPGFINFCLKENWLYQVIDEIREKGEDYGKVNLGKGKKIQVEFVSVNPTGPLHVGHGKCAAVGDALSNILKAAGYKVEKEYYINDQGRQIDLLGQSVQVRYNNLLGERMEFPADGYKGEYIVDIAKEVIEKFQDKYKDRDDQESREFFKEFTLKNILEGIKEDLKNFGVEFDAWFSESSLYKQNKLQEVIELLQQKGFLYKEKGALWLKTTVFGDEKDRVVIRKNSIPTYFASDIAYHQDKYQRGFEKIIDIWGADHHGYIQRMKAAVQALGYPEDSLGVLIVQFVTLIRDGKEVGMSTRGGEFITLRDLIKEVGKDVARYFFLMRSHDSHTEFDLDVAKSQSMENPVYYIQYAYARICSIIKKAEQAGVKMDKSKVIKLQLLNQEEEFELIKKLSSLKEVIKKSALTWKPHFLTTYLYDLASSFHKYYTVHRIITEDEELTRARLILIDCTRIVLFNSLKILGVSVPESM